MARKRRSNGPPIGSILLFIVTCLIGGIIMTEASQWQTGAVDLSPSKFTGEQQTTGKATVFQRAFPNSKQSQQDQNELSNSNNENNDGDMLMLPQQQQQQLLLIQQQVAYQGAIISVRGSLAFWRPSAPSAANNADNELASSLASPYFSQKRAQTGRGAPGVDGHLLGTAAAAAGGGKLVKCPSPLLSNRRSANLFESSAEAARWPEVIAVEGTTIKLNLVIVGHKIQQQQQHQQQNGDQEKQQQLYGGPAANVFRWTQNNQVLVYNTPRSRFQQHQLLPSENDIVVQNHHLSSHQPIAARFLAFQNNSSFLALPSTTLLFSNNLQLNSASQMGTTTDGNSNTNNNSLLDSFMLAPHLNEPLISRLETSKALDSRLASAIQAVGSQAKRAGQSLSLVDDFLASGQSIDWQKLETYLRFDANSLRLAHLAASQSYGGGEPRPGSKETNVPEKPPDGCAKLILEQSSVIQIELSHLQAHSDGGLYQLRICPQPQQQEGITQFASNTNNYTDECQLVAGFQLHLLQDIPHLESKSEHLILEPGDQLSIKCEATGFTLPQITWFLDNQQLNEHQQQLPGGHSTSMLTIDSASSNLLKIRIGDYVSQDNHVHSFVNASSVQVTDGGFYKCQANNGFHTVELQSRVDVRGPPVISRRLNNMNVLVGQSQLHIQCPFSGYPISSVEWYYRPSNIGAASTLINSRQQRAKRWPSSIQGDANKANLFPGSSPDDPGRSYLDADKDPDPDKDEWLSQANLMTTVANSDDYPDPLPDYPSNIDYADTQDLIPPSELVAEMEVPDYSDLETDFQQQLNSRRKRDTSDLQSEWIKFPQSRRHQIHLNGTLILHDVTRSDQGFYRCRIIQAPKHQAAHHASLYTSLLGHLDAGQQQLEDLSADSNEFHINVLVPPVISPFSSTEALREGMRNFLTCSVIEGDPPVRLQWLKDNQPIEEHLQMQQSGDWNGGRIRVETSNEYTSTLYFSQVDFNDSGNYTCMATNKAASVNYTARMLVNVPPKWINAPKDVECVAGQSIVIDCQARAHPNPRVWWEIGLYSSREDSMQANGSLANGNNNNNKHDQANTGQTAALAPTVGQQQQQQQQHNSLQQALQATNALQPPNQYRTIISNSRIHILENASLVIRDVHRLDQGYYLCQAANNFGSLSSLIKLTVNVGASFPGKYLMKYVKLNERVELDCDPFGQSPVDIVWLVRQPSTSESSPSSPTPLQSPSSSQSNHQNATFQAPSSSSPNLVLSNQSLPSSSAASESLGRRLYIGTIRTELTHNPRQLDQSAPSNGAIMSKPSLPIDDSLSSSNGQFFGQRQALSGVDHLLEPFATFEILKRPGDGSEFVRLHIKQARRAHSADLICQARNRYGSDEKLIKLLVQEAPDPVREMTAVQVDSKAAVLTWPAPYNGNSPIISYTVEWAQVLPQNQQQQQHQSTGKWSHMITQQPTATITSLIPMTTYEVRVRARNQFGQSNFATSYGAAPFILTTVEEAPAAPPSDLRATPISSSSIQLSWLAPGVPYLPESNHDSRTPQALNSQTNGILSQPTYSIKGYYLGYKATDTNDSSVFKTVSLLDGGNPVLSDDTDHLMATSGIMLNSTSTGQRQLIKNNQALAPRRIKVTISNLRGSTKYIMIVQAFNSAGPGPQSDQIEAKTLASDPPPAPILRAGLVTYSSIELQWSFQMTSSGTSELPAAHRLTKVDATATDASNKSVSLPSEKDVSAVDGYNVYYRALEGQWTEQKITPETHAIIASGHQRNDLSIVERSSGKVSTSTSPESSKFHGWPKDLSSLNFKSFRHILDQLACGNSYQIYLVAYNSIGTGLPSQIIRAKTRGSAPIAPRRQDYISINSTYVQLNFESWMDGGCSITNFEIRYKTMSRPTTTSSSQLSSDSASASNNGQDQWLLLSSNVSPEQRLIELRDLQPETWYAVLTRAESAAGKTEVQYSFMTLNKWGQLPAEAMESNNLPALFSQSNASIRSILYNFAPGGHMSALMMSTCMCLVIFATCLLFAIRRYGSQLKGSASLDSQTTTSVSVSQYQHHQGHSHALQSNHHLDVHHHQQAENEHQVTSVGQAAEFSEEQPMIYCGTNEQSAELYSLKTSPCKTTNMLASGGNSSSNGSSLCGGRLLNSTQFVNGSGVSTALPELSVDLNQFMHSNRLSQNEHHQYIHPPIQFHSSTLGGHHNSQQRDTYRCSSGCADTSIMSPGRTIIDTSSDNQNKFKTMSCRPMNTFATNSNIQSGMVAGGRFVCNGQPERQLSLQDYQHQLNDPQHIYSKLRVVYNNHSNHNLCGLEENQKNNQTILENNDQICNSDALNIAAIAQEQNLALY